LRNLLTDGAGAAGIIISKEFRCHDMMGGKRGSLKQTMFMQTITAHHQKSAQLASTEIQTLASPRSGPVPAPVRHKRLARRIGVVTAVLAFWGMLANCAWAGPIVQSRAWGAFNVYFYGPVGQTFTAEDDQISTIGFDLWSTHAIAPGASYPPGRFTYELRAGAGTSGSLVASSSFSLPDGFRGYADADFSSAQLTVGETYTVLVSASDGNWAIFWNQIYCVPSGEPIEGAIDYTGGMMVRDGQLAPYGDLAFRILPVPEPASATLLLLAAGALVVRRRARTGR
jgi:hypothetical protein